MAGIFRAIDRDRRKLKQTENIFTRNFRHKVVGFMSSIWETEINTDVRHDLNRIVHLGVNTRTFTGREDDLHDKSKTVSD